MKVVMVTSETLPFCKVGGLADVVYSLSRKLINNKVNASVVLPFYQEIKEDKKYKDQYQFVTTLDVKMAWRNLKCDIYKIELNKITFYFIGSDYYFNRENIYGEKDDFERFAFFALSSYELIFNYLKHVDIVHIHDWQGAILPLLNKHRNPKDTKTKFMLTIHNPAFQGKCDRNDLWNYFNLPEYYFDNGLARLDDKVNTLKSAIMLCDIISTVSPTHKNELLNGISAYGLDRVLKLRGSDFVGILNGLDTREFNPKTDSNIYFNYNKENVLVGKKENKIQLVKSLGFKIEDYPLIGIVSRLTTQKGINLIIKNIEKILKLKLNLVILGKGDKEFENQLSFYCMDKDNACCMIKYSNELAHQIYASSDFLLMPSAYEPCGIAQMIAMRYGTIPIASKVGGLIDTVVSYNTLNEEYANGVLFNIDDDNILLNILFALDMYEKKRIMSKLIHNAMNANFSWTKASENYLRLYRQMLQKNKPSN